MELKRYVQIRKEIFEVEEVIFNTDNYVQFKAVNENHKRTIYKGDGYKTSDKILDLVEVGDLVGYIFWGEEYEHIEKMIDTQHIEYELKYNDIRYKITAIYKLQPNGDYKKYEVSK